VPVGQGGDSHTVCRCASLYDYVCVHMETGMHRYRSGKELVTSDVIVSEQLRAILEAPRMVVVGIVVRTFAQSLS
jgi:hypothetical protein